MHTHLTPLGSLSLSLSLLEIRAPSLLPLLGLSSTWTRDMREPRHAGQITSLFLYVSEVSRSEVSRDVREIESLGKKEKLDVLFFTLLSRVSLY